ncbi:hypothetical protein [Nostoc foliaceum]|uniref:hypothetical protein n=1 Tax=Nostoc foliaceum TaxID=2692914 RepID=UPI001A7E4BD4|nr:hypothetical protein [Nostoc foliaceum]
MLRIGMAIRGFASMHVWLEAEPSECIPRWEPVNEESFIKLFLELVCTRSRRGTENGRSRRLSRLPYD